MNAISAVCQITHQPLFQACFIPVRFIYGIFLRAIGYLALFFGATQIGESLKKKGERIDSSCMSLLTGIWAFGRRFLVHTDNYDEVCRGSCYWFIDEHFSHPEKPLEEIAAFFSDGPPLAAIEMHKQNMKPAQAQERKIWSEESVDDWPLIPDLTDGIYTFLVGYSQDLNHPGKAHRFAFIKSRDKAMLFDPNTGLSIWYSNDWKSLLDRIGSSIRTSKAGYFTLECYSYHRIIQV